LSITTGELQKNDVAKMRNVPIRWMSPESLNRHPIYSTAGDVWSYGVLVYEVFNNGISPWPKDDDFKAIGKRICSFEMPEFPEATPKFVQKLVTEEIWKDHETRTGIEEVFRTLASYLCQNQRLFPAVETLVINRIEGVKRTQISESQLRSFYLATADY